MLFYSLERLSVEIDVVVCFLVLVYVLRFQIRIREKACTDGFEASIGRRQEDPCDVDDVAGIDLSAKCTVAVYCQLPRYVAHRYLICHLLDLDLLERLKL